MKTIKITEGQRKYLLGLLKESVDLSPGTWVHYENDGLLYKISKSSGPGPYAMTYGVVYVRDDNAARSWQKSKDSLVRDIEAGMAVVMPEKEARKLALQYKP